MVEWATPYVSLSPPGAPEPLVSVRWPQLRLSPASLRPQASASVTTGLCVSRCQVSTYSASIFLSTSDLGISTWNIPDSYSSSPPNCAAPPVLGILVNVTTVASAAQARNLRILDIVSDLLCASIRYSLSVPSSSFISVAPPSD